MELLYKDFKLAVVEQIYERDFYFDNEYRRTVIKIPELYLDIDEEDGDIEELKAKYYDEAEAKAYKLYKNIYFEDRELFEEWRA